MSASDIEVDIAIIGAGPVGMCLALGLAHRWGSQSHRIALIDAKTLEQACADPRTLALADTSRVKLECHGFPAAAVPIHGIHVSEQGRLGRVLMTAHEMGRSALGWTLRYGELIAALEPAVQASGVRFLRGRHVVSVQVDHEGHRIQCGDGTQVRAALRLDAEGGVFGDTEDREQTRAYGQHALVGHVCALSKPQVRGLQQPDHTVAFERFTTDGPLALLPTSRDGLQYALVWCGTPEQTAFRKSQDEAELLRSIEHAMGRRVRLQSVSSRLSFPLGMNVRKRLVGERSACVGNAAQILHPVAGQGLNLGLRDVDALVQRLTPDALSDAQALEDCLSAYESARMVDRTAIIALTDWMARGFATDNPLLRVGRQAALAVLENVPGMRRGFANTLLFGWNI